MQNAILLFLMLAGCGDGCRYQIATAEQGVWRVDTKTGEIKRCFFDKGEVVCLPATWQRDQVMEKK